MAGEMSIASNQSSPLLAGAAIVLAGMIVTVGTALAFQHVGGYIPCKLCLEQRTPYYIGIPVMAAAVFAAALRAPAAVTRTLVLAGAALMAWSAYLGGFHAGVEWGWWPGPSDCGVVTAPAGPSEGGVLDQLDAVRPPSCDEAAGRFAGLSFAGWNFVASVALAAVALATAQKHVAAK
jgi:disulfide bond formation protein DsbB